jgi:hypothetical protein
MKGLLRGSIAREWSLVITLHVTCAQGQWEALQPQSAAARPVILGRVANKSTSLAREGHILAEPGGTGLAAAMRRPGKSAHISPLPLTRVSTPKAPERPTAPTQHKATPSQAQADGRRVTSLRPRPPQARRVAP